MQDLTDLIQQHPSFRRIARQLEAAGASHAEGLWGSSAALLVAALFVRGGATALCVLPTVEQAETFLEDVSLFAPDLAMYFPAWETVEPDELPDADILSRRLLVLKWLFRSAPRPGAHVLVTPVQAVLQPVPPPGLLHANSLLLKPNALHPPQEIADWLVARDFQPVRRVEVPGEFCRRGGILDVFPYTSELPVRVEFFGDQIESLRTFDPGTQSSLEQIEAADMTAIPRRVMGKISRHTDRGRSGASLFDHLPPDTRLIIKEPAEVMRRDRLAPRLEDSESARACHDALKKAAATFPTLHLAALPGVFGGRPVSFHVHSIERFGHDLATTLHELELTASDRKRTIVFCSNQGEKTRLTEQLAESSISHNPAFEIRIGRMNHGFDWSDLSIALLTHHEIFRRYRQRRTTPRYRHTKALDTFYDLAPGDLVVHAVHGIAVFRGMEIIEKGPDIQECLRLEYANGAFLFVPASHVEMVQKYIGPSEHRPPLSRLGTKGWLRRKEKTEQAVRDLASELLRLQAVREAKEGIEHPPDDEWQHEFEAAFPYEETEDQLRIADEVKRDMEAPRPMDRLICGDVGYGKTEIAMRAAFKAATGGRQAAVLVPTTVLAAQHMQTFGERMADYPIHIRMLSRFLTRSQQAEVLEGLAQGRVDIVIGTHRLIQPDVHIKNLGLIIIDEEQRFGVEHKEQLKRLRETVDVLTLTATPIPRTLHMSLLGIRDIAALETPPRDRLAIHTRLIRYDPRRIRQAILHEMARNGQVFFLHNRVETINGVAAQLRKLVPEARILIGHGQMPERQLATVMHDFVEHRADVLVCTTIIESGLDIPNTNTIIINQADMFGLAELHQLRGRVGRYKHRAYAYMIIPADRPMTPLAEKRLKAIEEFCELGAGFRIAMRDLELRGAGNILGPEQSGYLASVGYDMYCKLMEQAVRALKNEPAPEQGEVALSIGIEAFLPTDYVNEVTHRIELYRKLQRATRPDDLDAVRTELRDRFGDLPETAENLVREARLRQLARAAAVTSLLFRDGTLAIQTPQCQRLQPLLSATGCIVRQVDDHMLHLKLDPIRYSGEILLSFLIDTFEKAAPGPIEESREA